MCGCSESAFVPFLWLVLFLKSHSASRHQRGRGPLIVVRHRESTVQYSTVQQLAFCSPLRTYKEAARRGGATARTALTFQLLSAAVLNGQQLSGGSFAARFERPTMQHL